MALAWVASAGSSLPVYIVGSASIPRGTTVCQEKEGYNGQELSCKLTRALSVSLGPAYGIARSRGLAKGNQNRNRWETDRYMLTYHFL